MAADATLTPTALGGARVASGHTVTLRNISFHPRVPRIGVGESVTWVWRDGGIEHNLTGRSFHSRTQQRGTFTVRFGRRGIFNYRCTIHVSEGMSGKVIMR